MHEPARRDGQGDAEYSCDFKLFRAFADEAAPGMIVLGPRSIGETTGERGMISGYGSAGADLLKAAPDQTRARAK